MKLNLGFTGLFRGALPVGPEAVQSTPRSSEEQDLGLGNQSRHLASRGQRLRRRIASWIPLLALWAVASPAGTSVRLRDNAGISWLTERSENDHLSQEVAILPYAPGPSRGGGLVWEATSLIALPEGKALVLRGNRMLQLTAAGLPDSTFGRGTGHVDAPMIGSVGDGYSSLWRLPDGRLLFAPESAFQIYRWTAEGVPDPTFGQGAGIVELTRKVFQVVQVREDGRVLLVSESADGRKFLQRHLPSGELDPDFVDAEIGEFERRSEWPWVNHGGSVNIAPDGSLWMIHGSEFSGTLRLERRHPDGRPDRTFEGRLGVRRMLGFDAAGRGYLQLHGEWHDLFGSDASSRLVRLSADGEFDAGYHPLGSPEWIESAVIDPDGSVLVVLGENRILDLDPRGAVRARYPTQAIPGELRAAQRQSGGRLLVQWVPHNEWGYLDIDGGLTPVPPFADVRSRYRDQGWLWIQRDNWIEDFGPPAAADRLFHILPPTEEPLAGFTRSGMITVGSVIQVPVRRTGSLARIATLRGTIRSWIHGRWDPLDGIPLGVTIPAGISEANVEMALPHFDSGAEVRAFQVCLEHAEGVGLSPLHECRVWVLGDTIVPPEGQLRLTRLPGPETAGTVLLLARGRSAESPPTVEWRSSMSPGGWLAADFGARLWLGSMFAWVIASNDSEATFYRLHN